VASLFPDLLTNLGSVIAALTVLFPGVLAYFTYIGLRSLDFDRIKRSHIVLILFFTLLFQILKDLSGGRVDGVIAQIGYFFILPVLLGVFSDIIHRIFVTYIAEAYQNQIIDRFYTLKSMDVGNLSRWQKTVRKYVVMGMDDITTEYYIEVEVQNGHGAVQTKRGFLNGYSDDDIELIRYDDMGEKEFAGIGSLDVDPDQLTMVVEIIPREKISSVKIFRVKMEDFVLE
jgi:hypothetical protein